jgi:competence protein ComEC
VPFSWPSKTPPEVWLPVPLALSSTGAWLIAATVAGLLLLPRRRTFRRYAVELTVLAVPAVLFVLAFHRPSPPDPELAMIDVGQGDSVLLRDGDHALLVDGGGSRGGDMGGRALLPALLGEGVSRLDALVMTHPDHDGCGGFLPPDCLGPEAASARVSQGTPIRGRPSTDRASQAGTSPAGGRRSDRRHGHDGECVGDRS